VCGSEAKKPSASLLTINLVILPSPTRFPVLVGPGEGAGQRRGNVASGTASGANWRSCHGDDADKWAVAGGGVSRGTAERKGVPGEWRLYGLERAP
jgi:hypothetical protein